ncbi:MAG TPA: hypothetical protein VMF89_21575, partial [Polyangiales bacterium]|nr:hypothetical protein [Polyangiales bacterium]
MISPWRLLARAFLIICSPIFLFASQQAAAQDDELPFTVNALVKLQGGLFVPLASSGFSPHENRAQLANGSAPCDPIL